MIRLLIPFFCIPSGCNVLQVRSSPPPTQATTSSTAMEGVQPQGTLRIVIRQPEESPILNIFADIIVESDAGSIAAKKRIRVGHADKTVIEHQLPQRKYVVRISTAEFSTSHSAEVIGNETRTVHVEFPNRTAYTLLCPRIHDVANDDGDILCVLFLECSGRLELQETSWKCLRDYTIIVHGESGMIYDRMAWATVGINGDYILHAPGAPLADAEYLASMYNYTKEQTGALLPAVEYKLRKVRLFKRAPARRSFTEAPIWKFDREVEILGTPKYTIKLDRNKNNDWDLSLSELFAAN